MHKDIIGLNLDTSKKIKNKKIKNIILSTEKRERDDGLLARRLRVLVND
jgi:hypothetical protein